MISRTRITSWQLVLRPHAQNPPNHRAESNASSQCIGCENFAAGQFLDVVSRKLISEIKLKGDQHGRPFREGTLLLSGDRRRVIASTDAYVGICETATGKLLKQLPFKTKEVIYDCAIDMLDGPRISR